MAISRADRFHLSVPAGKFTRLSIWRSVRLPGLVRAPLIPVAAPGIHVDGTGFCFGNPRGEGDPITVRLPKRQLIVLLERVLGNQGRFTTDAVSPSLAWGGKSTEAKMARRPR
jgi:hypothetical protein